MRILMWFVIGFVASTGIGVYALNGQVSLWLLLLLLPGIALCVMKNISCKRVGTLIVGLSIGFAWLFVYDLCYLQPARAYDGITADCHIEIADYSKASDYGIRAQGQIALDGKNYQIQVYLNDVDSVAPGDVVSGKFTLRMTTVGSKEGATYHQADGIFLLGYPQEEIKIQKAKEVPSRYLPARLRNDILNHLDNLFEADTVAIAKALLLGEGDGLTYEQDTDLKISGIRHVVAVSGLHVSILMTMMYMTFGRNKLVGLAVGTPLLLLFAAIAGFTPSVVRACMMQFLTLLALAANKEYDPPTALSFAVLVLLAINPLSVTSISLQLSTLCVVGIILVYPYVNGYLMGFMGNPNTKKRKDKLLRAISSTISVSISATVMTAPVCAYYFGMVSVVGILTNLLTMWAVTIIFCGIVCACILGAIWLPLGQIVAWAIGWLIRYVMLVAGAISSMPWSAVYCCSVYIVVWFVFAYILLGVFLLSKKKHPIFFVLCLCAGLVASLVASHCEDDFDHYRVTVIDVGQGQSVLIQFEDRAYLVDCGGDSDTVTADTVTAQLLSQGIDRLDGIILTHFDRDHAGGVQNLQSRIAVDNLYIPNVYDDSGIRNSVVSAFEERVCWVNDTMQLGTVNGMLTLIPGQEYDDENENSTCVLFQMKNYDILITGDRNIAGEEQLLKQRYLPELDVLVAGHHGAASATGVALLNQTQPKVVVISVSEDNPYGHPAKDTLKRLQMFGCKILRTDEVGTIIFRG